MSRPWRYAIPRVLRNRSWSWKRTAHNPRERVIAAMWQKECRRDASVNSGLGIAQGLLTKASEYFFQPHGGFVAVLGNREAMIAATMIQWLGTNVGMCFVTEALRRMGYKVEKREGFKAGCSNNCCPCKEQGKDGCTRPFTSDGLLYEGTEITEPGQYAYFTLHYGDNSHTPVHVVERGGELWFDHDGGNLRRDDDELTRVKEANGFFARLAF